jgi:glutamine amidotransferase
VSKLLIGLIDYGVGNLASVRHCLLQIGFNCRISNNPIVLEACDLLLLPGVGAFRPAMDALRLSKLDKFIIEQADLQRPILGICLGMQLLTEGSDEGGMTDGLALIPGRIVRLGSGNCHIGWNSLDWVDKKLIDQDTKNETYYFNHSYCYKGSQQYTMCITTFGEPFAAIIRRHKTIGIQFHPEKSQNSGHALLKQIIQKLCHA